MQEVVSSLSVLRVSAAKSLPQRRRGRRAFTLLEMLLAAAMVAMLAGALFASLHIAFRARDSALAAVEKGRKTGLALDLIKADLQSAVVPRSVLAGPFVGRSAKSVPGSQGDELSFHAAVADTPPVEGEGDIKKVEYACEPSASNPDELVLVRRITANLLAPTLPEPRQEIIMRGLRTIAFLYFDGLSWQDNWDSSAVNNALPKAVQVTLELDDQPGKTAGTASQVVIIPCGQDLSAAMSGSASASGGQAP